MGGVCLLITLFSQAQGSMCVRSVGLRTSRPQVRECSSGIVKGKERDRIEGPGPVFSPSLPQGAIGVP